MKYTAEAITQVIFDKATELKLDLTPSKLQYILFMVYTEYRMTTGERLFNEAFIIVANAVVLPSVAQKLPLAEGAKFITSLPISFRVGRVSDDDVIIRRMIKQILMRTPVQ